MPKRCIKTLIAAGAFALIFAGVFGRLGKAQPPTDGSLFREASRRAPQDERRRTGPPDRTTRITSRTSRLEIVERFSRIIELESMIHFVDGFDPEVLDVQPIDDVPTKVRVTALKPGITTLVLTDAEDNIFSIEVIVTGDVRHLQAHLETLFPDSAIQAHKVRDAVVLRGWVANHEQITEIVDIAEEFNPKVMNQMRVGGSHQVSLQVKIVEVQRAKIRQLGFNFLYLNQNGFVTSTPGGVAPVQQFQSPFGGAPSVDVVQGSLAGTTSIFAITDPNNVFLGFLDALKDERLLKVLAEPNLTAIDGRPATFISGGQFFIPVSQGLGQIGLQERDFGVELEFVPVVLDAGRVRLTVNTAVSERDFANAVTVDGAVTPGLTKRGVNTQVEMRCGQTLVIAGLIQNRREATTNKVPFLGELPWIGAAFRRVRYDHAETELLIMVTPDLVAPLDPDQVPPLGPGESTDIPTDQELFFLGQIEVPAYGPRCPSCEAGVEHMHFPSTVRPLNGLDGGTAPPAPVPERTAGGLIRPTSNGRAPLQLDD